ncbi:MAG: Sua5/YciO/YrdC/YwlC family protein, partial [Patescibacteria group bacterium]|nr:Sua5/YciO/YrdC/YwlC family protein [Patescibacteria group bacterium]
AAALADRFWPGPLGLVLPIKKEGLAQAAMEGGYAGMRVPDNAIAARLSREAGVPLVATSANTSGKGPCYSPDDVRASLGANASKVDAFVDGGILENRAVSTMVKVWDNQITVLREGAVDIKNENQ